MFKNQLFPTLGAIALAVGVAVAGYFVGQTMLNQRIGANTASVKGLSERIVPADAATWRLNYALRGDDFNQVAASFEKAEAHMTRVRTAMESSGFSAEEFIIAPLQKSNTTTRNKDGNIVERYYQVFTNVYVSTNSPQKIGEAAKAISKLSREGIDLRQSPVNYEFTKLNDIKPDMLREATENARIAADKFAENAGVKVGGIQQARQGGFSVLPANTGDARTRERNKLVRVVTTITFYLDN